MQTGVTSKPDTVPVLFDEDYRRMIALLLDRLEQRDITIYDLQQEVIKWREQAQARRR